MQTCDQREVASVCCRIGDFLLFDRSERKSTFTVLFSEEFLTNKYVYLLILVFSIKYFSITWSDKNIVYLPSGLIYTFTLSFLINTKMCAVRSYSVKVAKQRAVTERGTSRRLGI